jgi:hypothetical protein
MPCWWSIKKWPPFGRHAAPVQRHGRTHRELRDRRVSGLCQQLRAGVATKPQLAQRMIERAVAAQMPFAWLTRDAMYANDRRLRVWLEQRDLHFVLGVAGNSLGRPDLSGQKTFERCNIYFERQSYAT